MRDSRQGQVVHRSLALGGCRRGAGERLDHQVGDPARGLHVAGGDGGRRARVQQASLGRDHLDRAEGAGGGRRLGVGEHADGEEGGRLRDRQGAVEVAVDLGIGAGEVERQPVGLDPRGDPQADVARPGRRRRPPSGPPPRRRRRAARPDGHACGAPRSRGSPPSRSEAPRSRACRPARAGDARRSGWRPVARAGRRAAGAGCASRRQGAPAARRRLGWAGSPRPRPRAGSSRPASRPGSGRRRPRDGRGWRRSRAGRRPLARRRARSG